MNINEIYKQLDSIGVLTFSTIYNGEVHSRAAHLNGYDENGIYFRTMGNKPFARQLKENGKLTICGISDTRILGYNKEGVPKFPKGYVIRLILEVKYLEENKIRELAKKNKKLELAVVDMEKYPAMKDGNFMIVKAKGEIFDFDFGCEFRDHKILRNRFKFGDMSYNEAGPKITDKCIGCGKCYDVCSFKAIEKGMPYKIDPKKCDDCGSCIQICPINEIDLSLPL